MLFTLLFCLIGSCPRPGEGIAAQGGAEDAPAKLNVTLVVILAREGGDAIDPRLKQVAEEVRKINPNLKSFQLKTMTKKTLAIDEKTVIALVEDQQASIVIQHGVDKENKVGVAVTAPEQGEIVYRTIRDKFLPIITRYTTRNGERLILAISIESPKRK